MKARKQGVLLRLKTFRIPTSTRHSHGFMTKDFGIKNDGRENMQWTI